MSRSCLAARARACGPAAWVMSRGVPGVFVFVKPARPTSTRVILIIRTFSFGCAIDTETISSAAPIIKTRV